MIVMIMFFKSFYDQGAKAERPYSSRSDSDVFLDLVVEVLGCVGVGSYDMSLKSGVE